MSEKVPFTSIPNHIIDNMHRMKGSVFQVVCAVARKTIGYSDGNGGRKEWDVISLSQFEQMTGLKRPTIITALHAAVTGGWIERRERGQSFEYQLVKKFNQLENLTSKEIEPVEEPTSKESLPELVKKVNTQKKEKKQTNNIADEDLPDHQQWFSAMCWLVHGHQDHKLLSKEDSVAIGRTIKQIRASEQGYTIDDLRKWYRDIWSKTWPGKQEGKIEIQRPSLKQVRVGIGAVVKKTPEQFTANGSREGVWGMLDN